MFGVYENLPYTNFHEMNLDWIISEIKALQEGGAGGTTYTLSMEENVITLTGADGTTSSVTLPVYDGTVTDPEV